MARIACSTWDGGGNVAVFRALGRRLEVHGHEVSIQVGWDRQPALDGDVLLLDHMTPNAGIEAALASGRPVATVVHTLWSFVPSLEGTFAPAGYLDLLAAVGRNLVFSVESLDGDPLPDNVVHVGPVLEGAGSDAGWSPPGEPLVIVGLGTTPMGEEEVLQRVLDGLGDLDVVAVATVGPHVDASLLQVPANAMVSGYVAHAAMLPNASVFIGHGGHGGIMAALAHGVPLVSIPLDRDQPHNAARVEAVGAGRTVAKDASPDAIGAAVMATLADDAQRASAAALAKEIADLDGTPIATIQSLIP